MEQKVGMRLARVIASVLIGLLLTWGGLATPVAPKAFAHDAAFADAVACDDQEGRAAGGGQHDHTKHPATGCCAMACSVTAVEPTAPQMAPMAWTSVGARLVAHDPLRERAVAPLRRPPRTAA
ncbi:hypothetical protein [Azospirillum soli]|uniref:hypothetical protein n=1 Tax=Azospirillum soli TaxID=1304799 RepID=UPI001AE248ED|nr:hypothetical protein [Azospirillum soli]MBP2311819.1 hypothetical protein [Azospirillum soli]